VEVADEPESTNVSIDAKKLTEYELRRIEEEAEFDLRIKRLKNELAGRLPEGERKGTEALTLHPHVHNLPHNIISDYYDDLPDVEISQ
jgi:hypothetical protein